MSQRTLDGFALGVALALVTLAMGIVLWLAAARTEAHRIDVRRFVQAAETSTTTLPCCPAGAHGSSKELP